MKKAKKLLNIAFGIAILVIAVTSDDWSKSRAVEIAEGKVTKITDGDTLRAIVAGKEERIRLAYIDCPERDQPRGDAATASLRSAVDGQAVRLDIVDVDRYDRKVAEVYSGDRNINLYLVRSGKCYVYRKYAKGRQDYFEAESHAQAERLGVHKDPNAIKPWDWRRR